MAELAKKTQQGATNSENDAQAVNPEELRERRLAYFQLKSASKQLAKDGYAHDDAISKPLRQDKIREDDTKPKAPDKFGNPKSTIADNVAGVELEEEFSRQDYRVNSPLKEVKLKPTRSTPKTEITRPPECSENLSQPRHFKVPELIQDQEFDEKIKLHPIARKNPDNLPPTSLQESQNLDSVSVFQSEADLESLGLSTHRPASPPSTVSVLDKRLNGDNPILDASEIKSLLGDEKYEEFLQKSVKDINALYKHKTTETSPRLLDQTVSVLAEQPAPNTTEYNVISSDKNTINFVHNNINKNSGIPPRQQVSLQPEQSYKNIHNLEQEIDRGQGSRNYDQVLVSRNVTFSADEIYRQAYGPIPIDPRSAHQQMTSSPPYNVVISPRQQNYPMAMNVQNYQQVPTGMCMYNGQGDYFMSPNSPVSPQASFFQPYFPGNCSPSPPQRQFVYPGVMSSSPPGPTQGYHNYQQQHAYNTNNSNQYQVYLPHPPHPPPHYQSQQQHATTQHQHPQHTIQYQHSNHQAYGGSSGWTGVQNRNQYNSYSGNTNYKHTKDTNVQKEAMIKHKETKVESASPSHKQLPVAKMTSENDRTKNQIKENTSLRHKEAVRQYHEQRRNLQEDQVDQKSTVNIKPNSYAASSLNRYFSSLENLNAKTENDNDDNLTIVTETSGVTATSVNAGGITDRIEKLGITIPNLKPKDALADEPSAKIEKKYKICPECSTTNKDYMTWCSECGEVLIGVRTITSKKKHSKGTERTQRIPKKEKKSVKDATSTLNAELDKMDRKENSHVQINKPNLKSVIDSPLKPQPTFEQVKEAEKIIERNSPRTDDKPKFDPKFYRTDKDINDICEVITDPVIRGYIRSYFKKKTGSALAEEEGCSSSVQDHPDKLEESTKPLVVSSEHLEESPDTMEATETQHRTQPDIALDLNLSNNTSAFKSAANSTQTKSQHFGKKNDNVSRETKLQTKEAEQGTQPEVSLDLNMTNSTAALKDASTSAKKKGTKFGKKKDNVEIDIEVFGMEESRESKSSIIPVVPSLNLASSSDEDEPRNRDLMVDSSVDTDVFQAVMDSKTVSNGIVKDKVPEKSNFLAQILGPKGSTPKKVGTSKDVSTKPKKKVVPSKVSETVNSLPYQRRWEKSNLAWSAIHPKEINLKSSVSMPKARIGFASKGKAVYSLDNFGSVDMNSINQSTQSTTDGHQKKQRPASADLYKRKVQQQRPTSAQVRPMSAQVRPASAHVRPTTAQMRPNYSKQIPVHLQSDNVDIQDDALEEFIDEYVDVPDVDDQNPVNMPTIVDHRLPTQVARVISQSVNLVPETSVTAYNKYIEMTPRIQEGNFSPWVCMPDEIWLHIFSYLNHVDLKNCGCVCQQFHRVALDEVLWKYIAVKKQHNICDDWLHQIGKRHPISLALIQCHGDFITIQGLCDMFKECSETLRELNFTRCSRGGLTGDNILLNAAIMCHNLTHIDASWCHVTDNALLAIAESSNRLESVCLNGCQVISDVGLEALIKKHGGSLRVLEMFGCFNISQRGLRFIANNCRNLYTLNLGQCYKLTDSCMTQISANLGRIENLDLRGCKQIRDNCVRKIVRNCPRLKTLVLANCPNISNDAMVEVATYSMDIRNLDVCGCRNISDISIRNITNNCLRLTALDISSTGCSTASVNMLANYGNRCLESVKLNFLTDVTEASLLRLVKHCSRLKTLHLYGCSSVRNIYKLIMINKNLDVEM
ncbi:hypothetical protein SNE40_003286 [Patella caerulea]|uniref:F-box domain-containing protein n=1 Tax=Patella caerulea TaxID=87958 RepID=A0AAN8KDY1_PATCE